MNHLSAFDRSLVFILVPVWALCFALGIKMQLDGGGGLMLGLSLENSDSYPVLTGDVWAGTRLNSLETAGLRPGDKLVRVGSADLRGAGVYAFGARVRQEAGTNFAVNVVYERQGEQHETSLALTPVSTFRPWLATSLAFAASALFLLLRVPTTPMVQAYFHASFCLAFVTCAFGGSLPAFYGRVAIYIAATTLSFPLLFRLAFLFPDNRAPQSVWHSVWPWFFALVGPLLAISLLGISMKVGDAGAFVVSAMGLVVLLVVITHKYSRADRVARRQIKWVLFGGYCAALPVLVATVLVAWDARSAPFFFLSFWAVPLLPVFLLISIARFNLFDIDRLLSATASYNIVIGLLVAGALIVVPRIADAGSALAGVAPETGQVVLSLLLAGVTVPMRRRLGPRIDRVFFNDRYALDKGIAALLPALSKCANTGELTQTVGDGVNRLLHPETCVIYARVEENYAPVFVEGRAIPPIFKALSPLILSLQARGAPLGIEDESPRRNDKALGPFDRAALETLQATVIVPMHDGETLAAFLCLGAKQSGDVYTSTDLAHLAAVAETFSLRIRAFDQEQTIRVEREMQESLRRYVPGAVAEQLSSGIELASAEREVSVLFVDIRGYTTYSESREPEEIFSMVNRYTDTVSQVVRRHGGSVVEFNGDGMMAVFGAPAELPHKERAAVDAATEIFNAVGSMAIDQPAKEATRLSVGVGIATGKAFVGNIQAVDRMIWTAIGSTVNLAARLQTLTRQLDAAISIDAATWNELGTLRGDFRKQESTPIRGRSQTQDVYFLPLGSHPHP